MPTARLEAIDSLTGEALLRMVHTRHGAWVANAVLCYGTAKHCKSLVKAMKGIAPVIHMKTLTLTALGPSQVSTLQVFSFSLIGHIEHLKARFASCFSMTDLLRLTTGQDPSLQS